MGSEQILSNTVCVCVHDLTETAHEPGMRPSPFPNGYTLTYLLHDACCCIPNNARMVLTIVTATPDARTGRTSAPVAARRP